MSVIVKGMDMPTNCTDCPLNHNQMACRVTGTRWWSDTMVLMNFDSDKERLHDCPLVEIPTPHERLIDIRSVEDGKFVTVGNDYQRWWNGALESVIDNAPTVIEGSET